MLQPPTKSGPRFNTMITSDKVRVIDETGENIGVMYTREAIEQAAGVGLDLVEVSPNADPPVCKFLDVGKFRYEAQKKANLARKSQKTQEIKEIKMRPNIDDHDYDVKMRSVNRFIDEGDKVKITLRFRGRELSHQQLGMNLLKRVQDDTAEVAKIEADSGRLFNGFARVHHANVLAIFVDHANLVAGDHLVEARPALDGWLHRAPGWGCYVRGS